MRIIVVLMVGITALAAHAQELAQLPAGLPPTPSVAEQAEFYQRIARIESTATLEQLAREAVAASPGAPQRAEISVIVERYFELDAPGAVRLAGWLSTVGVGDFVAPLYERLARDDPNEAMSALSQIDDPGEAAIAAMATYRGLGGDERAFELVAASLQGDAAARFRTDALWQLAATSPREALAEALALTDPARREGIASSVIGRWASDAPSEAIAAAERVEDPALRAMLRDTVLRNWSDLDSLEAYFATLDPDSQRAVLSGGALYHLMRTDPLRLAELAERLPPGEDRRRVLLQIGTSYAQQDAEAALAWAQDHDDQDPELIVAVMRILARTDPLRVLDLAETLAEPARSQAYLAAIAAPADERQFPTFANRVLRMQEDQTKTALMVTLIDTWARYPSSVVPALDWMLTNAAVLPAQAFERVGYRYAQSDPSAAAAYIDRVPNAARSAWISAVAVGYAQTDPRGAVAFLDRFRGDPAYDGAAIALARPLAAFDPPAAARLLASVGSRGADGAGPEIAIAGQWAQRDPAAAAAWALDLPPLSRNIAMSIVTGTWARQDPEAVREWALQQPPGERRDAALMAAVRTRGASPPDPVVLSAFSDDRARQSALMNTILSTAQSDTAAARRLTDEYITDPRLRAQAEQMIDGFARGAVPLPAGGFGIATGVISGAPPLTDGVPTGRLFGPSDLPMLVIGPNGQPMRLPSPELVPLPPGALPPPAQTPLPAHEAPQR